MQMMACFYVTLSNQRIKNALYNVTVVVREHKKMEIPFFDQCLLCKAKQKGSICLLYKPFGFAWQ